MSIQDSVTTQLGAAVRALETTPFCMFFFFFNSELKEKKKNLKKRKKKKEKEKRKTLRGIEGSEEHPTSNIQHPKQAKPKKLNHEIKVSDPFEFS